jgi:hypothetical protein
MEFKSGSVIVDVPLKRGCAMLRLSGPEGTRK